MQNSQADLRGPRRIWHGRGQRRLLKERASQNSNSKADPSRSPTRTPVLNNNNTRDDQVQASEASPKPSMPAFTDLPKAKGKRIHPMLLRTILEDLKFSHMTPVQAATIYPLLRDECDLLAQAKTGTGKTLAFLLPAIQKILTKPIPSLSAVPNVSLLVISPTRELAMQIAEEARALLQRLPKYKVSVAIGGTNKIKEKGNIFKGCDILIGTPGRLLDHLGDEDGILASKLQGIDTLVLDEADRLLDMGFLDALKKIVRHLPDKAVRKRQSMLFSATMPSHVQTVAELILSEGYQSISTVAQGDLNTHERVPQNLTVVPTFSDMAAGLLGALHKELGVVGSDVFKAIVFIPTARLVDFYVGILENSPNLPPVKSLHSKMTQSRRSRVTEEFRQAQNCILVATDVIARGMDFPSVTNVFQAGVPSDKETYIHRLGRTARAGAEGRGTLIITSHETFFPERILKDISFEETSPDLSARESVSQIAEKLDPDVQDKAYQGWLGFYKSLVKPMGWNNDQLVKEANEFALNGLGTPEVPALPKRTVGKMGLAGVKGLVIK